MEEQQADAAICTGVSAVDDIDDLGYVYNGDVGVNDLHIGLEELVAKECGRDREGTFGGKVGDIFSLKMGRDWANVVREA